MSTVPEVRRGRFSRETEAAVKPARPEAPKRHGIGLCLSGGGYRATLFHLGAARRLHELGILEQVRTISSVSGGSIFAAKLARLAMREDSIVIDDFEQQVAKPVRDLTCHDVRTLPYILTLPYNWLLPGPRAHFLQYLLGRHLPSGNIRDLPKHPRLAICATDLTNGVAWVSSRDRTGSWKYGYPDEATGWPLAWAVAASACFPPFFGPLPLGSRIRALAGRPRISLSDGGVYDNMGLEPVWTSHSDVLVSDAGAPFKYRSARTPWGRLLRYTTVVMKQTHSLRMRMLHDGLEGEYKWAFWDIDVADDEAPSVGYSKDLIDERIAKVRTDLDRFNRAEQRVLENHGYWSAEEQVQRFLPHLVADGAPDARAPHPKWMDERRVRRALRFSHHRFWPPRAFSRC